jgi:hypothetical protein
MEVEPPPSPLAAVCCMCGDRGLPHELLRCKLCRVRMQHRYVTLRAYRISIDPSSTFLEPDLIVCVYYTDTAAISTRR